MPVVDDKAKVRHQAAALQCTDACSAQGKKKDEKKAAAKAAKKAKLAALPPDAPRPRKAKNLEELINSLPKPADPKNRATFVHKNGWGMKFFRKSWRYDEPCFWCARHPARVMFARCLTLHIVQDVDQVEGSPRRLEAESLGCFDMAR